jgi:two-component sensor histidine kinase/tetratricopeptide (TPR) repeat protein
MRVYCFILFSIISFYGKAQDIKLDSLQHVTQTMKDDSTKAINLIIISNRLRIEKVDYPNAKKTAEEAIAISEKINCKTGVFKGNIALGFCIRDMSMNVEAIEIMKKAIFVFENTKELKANTDLYINHISIYTVVADIYTLMNDFSNAEKYANKALQLSEIYKVGNGKSLMALSNIFTQQENIAEAKNYALKALEIFIKDDAFDEIARTYTFLAKFAYKEGNYNAAIDYFNLCFEAYKKANSIFGARVALYNLAQVYAKVGNIDKAEACIIEIEKKYASALKDAMFLNQLKKFRFNIKIKTNDFSGLLNICNDLLDYAIKEKSIFNMKEAYGKYLLVYLNMKDTSNAFLMSEKISNLKDTLYKADISKNTSALAKQYETAKKEQQIIFLEKENKLNQEKLTKESQLSQALKTENLLKQAMLSKEHLLAEALTRENELKDEQIDQKIALQNGLERENKLKKAELYNESLLNKTLQNQNTLMAEKSRNETKIRLLMMIALIGFTTIGINYFRSYQKEKLANQKITKQSEDLKVLMREVHHRVKNNLQVIVAMLRMQARRLEDKSAIEALVNSENRLQSIALVHEKLYKSNSIGGVLLKDYLQELMDVLADQFQNKVPNFTYTVNDNSDLTTNLETAIPLGMIVNELVTNSFKYAFTTTPNAMINIQFDKLNNNIYQLTVTDNGPGLANGQLPKISNGFGLKLVQLFTEQLNGTLTYSADNGSTFMVSFSAVQTAS